MKKLSWNHGRLIRSRKDFKKIGSVVFELWPFYLITLWSAFVSITKNEHDETTYSESMERSDCLIAL